MATTDPADWTGEQTGTFPVQTLSGESYGFRPAQNPLASQAVVDAGVLGLWFTTGWTPDGRCEVIRVDDPENLPDASHGDISHRNRHLLRALLRQVSDMLDGEDNS